MPTTRDGILDSAERLLARLGSKKTTMEYITFEAGPEKRTLYLQAASKAVADLLAGLLLRRTVPTPREKSL